jgi:hypothetical protein
MIRVRYGLPGHRTAARERQPTISARASRILALPSCNLVTFQVLNLRHTVTALGEALESAEASVLE